MVFLLTRTNNLHIKSESCDTTFGSPFSEIIRIKVLKNEIHFVFGIIAFAELFNPLLHCGC